MTAPHAVPHRASLGLLITAGGCLFATGFGALVYEICWIRKASLAFGSATWALSAVLAVFFAGLACGGYVVGRLTPRLANPLRAYAWLEMGVGVLAIVSPALFALTDAMYGTIYPRVLSSMPLLAITRLIAVAIVIFPATTLMGGSLPLFCRQFVRQRRHVLGGVGLLYGLNTLGAAAGAALCGFWLIPRVGVNASIYLAAGLNFAVGVVAFWLGRRWALDTEAQPGATVRVASEAEAALTERASPVFLGCLFFGVGFVALAHEVLWTRYLSLWMPNTVSTYTLTLSVVLLGIVCGSLLAAAVPDRAGWRAALFGAAQVASGLAVMMVMHMKPGWWGEWFSAVTVGRQLAVIATVMLVPAVLSGLSFPLAVRFVVHDASHAGSGVGTMAAINMVGGIAGSLVAGFAALPWLGLQVTVFVTTGMSVLIGVVAWWKLQPGRSWLRRATWGVAGVVLWAAIPWTCGTRLPQDFLAVEGALVDFREGIGANVSVVRKAGVLQLQINRMWQGQNVKNHQVMAAHIPAILHGAPKSVLVIGLGTGQTARGFLIHDMRRLDCVEIEDGLVDLVKRHFDATWMQDPRVRLIVEDGRNYVTHTNERYDLISVEVGQIYRPRVASFYTVDFYQRVRRRLAAGGMVCQFLPIEFVGTSELRTMVATFLSVFPRSVLWYNTSELLLVGTEGRHIVLNGQALEARVAGDARLKRDLDYAYWGGPAYYLSRPEVFLAGFLCGSAQLGQLSEGAGIYRDERPYLEYVPPLGPASVREAVSLIQEHLSPLDEMTEGSGDQWLAAAHKIREQNLREIVAHTAFNRGRDLEAAGQLRDAVAEYTQAVREMPEHPKANLKLAELLQSQGRHRESIHFYRRALATKSDDVSARHELAIALAIVGESAQAREEFQQLLALEPGHVAANYQLGTLLQEDGQLAEAEEHFRKSLRANPRLRDARVSLAGVLVLQQRLEDAIVEYREALIQNRRDADLHVRLGWTLAMAGHSDEATACFREALRLQPAMARAHLGMGNVLSSAGQLAEAAQAYQRAAALGPNLFEAHVGLARVMEGLGRWSQALEHYVRALRLNPDDPSSLCGAAWILATRPDDAERDARQAVAWAERAWQATGLQDPRVADVLAAAHAAAGQFEQAVQIAERALQLATAAHMDEFAEQVRQRLALYRQQQPFVQRAAADRS